MTWPVAKPKSEEYAYVDPKNAHYGVARLGPTYHPLDCFHKFDRKEMEHNLSHRLFYPFWGSLIFVFGCAYQNWIRKRPLYSTIYKYGFAIAGGVAVGEFFWHAGRYYAAKRDAVLQHYLELHYDDFPVVGEKSTKSDRLQLCHLIYFLLLCVERKKYKDVFGIWIPIRG